LQAKPQVLLVQVATPWATAGHAWAHALQLPGSLVSSTQKPLHSEYPELHVNEQALPMHAGLALTTPVEQEAQAVPLPQADGEVPGAQLPALQQPLVHWYALPQPPQLL
jgi:hypothetical protein